MKRFLFIGISLLLVGGIVFGLYLNPDAAASIKKQIFGDDEPDLPDFAKYKIDKEDFMRRRAENLAAYRGIHKDQPFDPQMRFEAIEKMKQQQAELAKTAVPQAVWTEIGPKPIPNGPVETGASTPASGRVTAIAVHPTDSDIVYVGAAQGGLYRTTDGGTTWTQLFNEADSLAVNAIAIAPSEPETIYVGTGEAGFCGDCFFGAGLYRIESASTTATLFGPFGKTTSFVGRSISKIVVHPTVSSTIFVTSASGIGGIGAEANPTLATRGLFRSTDATAAAPTFTKLGVATTAGEDRNMVDMAMDPTDASRLLVAVSSTAATSGVWLTTTALAATPTFTRELVITGSTTSTSRTELAINRVGGTLTVFAASADAGGTVQRSVDGGDTWTLRIDNDFCTPQCFYDIAVAVNPLDADDVYLGGSPSLVFGRSADGGSTFTADGVSFTEGLHVDTHVIAVAPSDPEIVYFGSDGGIYKTLDVTATPIVWTSLNNSTFSATQFMGLAVHSTDPNFTIGGTQDNGTNYYDTSGAWLRIDGGDGGYSLIDQTDTGLIAVDNYHTYFSAASFMGYAYAPTVVSPTYTFRGCTSAGATANGITCTGSVLFYAPLEQGPPVMGSLGNTIYYGTTTLYRSTDTGLTHTVASQTFATTISAIGIAPTDDAVRLLGGSGGGLAGTVTGSTPLTDFDPMGVIPDEYIARTVIDPGSTTTAYVTLAVFGVTNVWKTTTLSPLAESKPGENAVLPPTWVSAAGTGMTGLPLVPVNAFVVDASDSSRLYAGTDIGVYTSGDGGSTWMPFGTGLPKVAVFDMAMTAGAPGVRKIRIATHGRGMWEIAALTPSAAAVSVSGRVTSAGGTGVFRAAVTITGAQGITRRTLTNPFGFYQFDDIEVGQTYTVQAASKRFQFAPQVIFVTENTENVDFASNGK